MIANKYYTEVNPDEIAALFVGRRIVAAEMGTFDFPGRGSLIRAEGLLVLDDGTELYLTGNDGGCSCSAGCYPLDKVAAVDNVITSARVEALPADDYDGGEGRYSIFVFADNEEINVAEFVGNDGNGYYGTGFSLIVVPAPRPEVGNTNPDKGNTTMTELRTFRKKPVEIQAIQFTGDNVEAIWDAFGAAGIYGPTEKNPDCLILTTIHGDKAPCRPGDWIIPEPHPGRFYPCKPDIFAATYDEVS